MIALPTLAELDRDARVRVWLCVLAIDMRLGFDRLADLACPLNEPHLQSRRRRGDDAGYEAIII